MPKKSEAFDVAAIRNELGLSQVEFAGRLETSANTVWRWEQAHGSKSRVSPTGPARVAMKLLLEIHRLNVGAGKD